MTLMSLPCVPAIAEGSIRYTPTFHVFRSSTETTALSKAGAKRSVAAVLIEPLKLSTMGLQATRYVVFVEL